MNEVKKLDGSDFPPCTLKDIILGIQFCLEMEGYFWCLIDDDSFKSVHFILDNLMMKCTNSGLGNYVCQAQVLSYNDEELMWQMGILESDIPRKFVDKEVCGFTVVCY